MISTYVNSGKTETTYGKKRYEEPTRFRRAKSDSSIASIQKVLENNFGLPKGSIRLVYPNGRKARADSTVGLLRNSWETSS